ncbi:MAG: hypothetical protein MJ154_01705 [Candidatus Saccharibacteria bacterium]|nr:hypothetical protein [Candidatus Saccharibacteria bacterium]
MAGKTDAAKGKGKGVAFAKWAKIDSAQQKMFLAVCGTSILLGITIVSIVYFAKVITFNGTLISEKDKIIKDYTSIQNSLKNISEEVNDLSNNENLEAVARTRAADCAKYLDQFTNSSDEEESNDTEEAIVDEIELARVCSALRVIPDAIPSKENVEATLASLNQLLLWSDGTIKIDGISGNDADEVGFKDDAGNVVTTSLKPIGASLSLDDTSNKVRSALDTIENSIRNYDIASASISFSGDSTTSETIEFHATFRAYYSDTINIEKKSKKVCADQTSEKCTGRKAKKK